MRDDMKDGWSGMQIIQNVEKRYMREVCAYQIEIELASRLNRPDIVERLMENLEKERKALYGL